MSSGLTGLWRLVLMTTMPVLAGCAFSLASLIAPEPAVAQSPTAERAARNPVVRGSGLPVPRYVSLKSDRINIRKGPGLNYAILWVFRRAGLPVEVFKEFNGWRQIRDAEGSEGWVLGAMLSGRRTALVLPWELKSGQRKHIKLRQNRSASSPLVARLEAGVLAGVLRCSSNWCEVAVGNLRGYVEQKTLWGIYPDEKLN